jgi:LCP family protein required for cell wall assembly
VDEPSDAAASDGSPSDSSPSDSDKPDTGATGAEERASEDAAKPIDAVAADAVDEPTRPDSPLWAKLFLIIGTILLVVSTVTVVAIRVAIYRLDRAVAEGQLLHNGARTQNGAHQQLTGPLNYLLIGSDFRSRTPDDGQRSDTIIAVHVPRSLDRAYLISIPRDLLVEIPPFGPTEFAGTETKINAAYQYGGGGFGGIQLLSITLSKLLGVQFDGAAIIDFDGFRRAVDVLGGITLCVDHEVRAKHLALDRNGTLISVYTDPEGNPFVPAGAKLLVYRKGCQHMTGEIALEWTRIRYGLPAGDYDRQRHQQEFLRAMFSEAERQGVFTNPVKLDSFLQAVGSSLTVDANGRPLEDLVFGLRNIRPSTLVGIQVPSHPDNIGGVSYVLPEKDAASLYHAIRDDTVEAWVLAHPDWVNQL